jgi:hypothetical protein
LVDPIVFAGSEDCMFGREEPNSTNAFYNFQLVSKRRICRAFEILGTQPFDNTVRGPPSFALSNLLNVFSWHCPLSRWPADFCALLAGIRGRIATNITHTLGNCPFKSAEL